MELKDANSIYLDFVAGLISRLRNEKFKDFGDIAIWLNDEKHYTPLINRPWTPGYVRSVYVRHGDVKNAI